MDSIELSSLAVALGNRKEEWPGLYKQSFPSQAFHVVAVQAATIWTKPESARSLDTFATAKKTDLKKWLTDLSKEEKLALCDDNRIQTQALYGEAAIVSEVKSDWAKVFIPSQPTKKDERGYPGWVPRHQLRKVKRVNWFRPEMAAVIDKYAWLENETGEKILQLSFMTSLPIKQMHAARVEVLTPEGIGFLPKEAIASYPTERGAERKSGEDLVRSGEQFIGLEYLWGGMSSFGYDCSGFTYGMHKANGYQISRDASDQATYGKEIARDELKPGDLLFFANEEGKGSVHHVGFYYGKGKMLHAPATGKGIEIVSLAGTKYERNLAGARRYWEGGDG